MYLPQIGLEAVRMNLRRPFAPRASRALREGPRPVKDTLMARGRQGGTPNSPRLQIGRLKFASSPRGASMQEGTTTANPQASKSFTPICSSVARDKLGRDRKARQRFDFYLAWLALLAVPTPQALVDAFGEGEKALLLLLVDTQALPLVSSFDRISHISSIRVFV